jgi:RNA polymerase-associated protein LEO1
MGERGRYDDGEDGAFGAATLNVMDVTLGRAPEPISSNGEVCLA